MATIRLTCPTGCGDLTLDARKVRTHTNEATGAHALTYRCPSCGLAAARPIDDSTLVRCTAAGVAHRALAAPGELADPDRNATRPAPLQVEYDAAVAALRSINDVGALLAACG